MRWEGPSYLKLYSTGELQKRAQEALSRLSQCQLCPRRCRVNRLEGQKGFCKTGRLAWVSSYSPHFGEEAPLVGRGGSGTIFFTHCNLLCVFCQNYDISHQGIGDEVSPQVLARMMVQLQNWGCHNVNFVTPTHVVAQILEALPLAVELGLRVPLVYNTGGYDLVDTLRLLDGVFDIYMPDIKFMDPQVADRFCKAPDYPQVVKEAVKEMHRQVGDLIIDERGLGVRGLLVRHLVMPDGLAQSKEVMEFLATEISKDTYVNIMDQWRPCGEAYKYPELSKGITSKDYLQAVDAARSLGLSRLDDRVRIRFFRIP